MKKISSKSRRIFAGLSVAGIVTAGLAIASPAFAETISVNINGTPTQVECNNGSFTVSGVVINTGLTCAGAANGSYGVPGAQATGTATGGATVTSGTNPTSAFATSTATGTVVATGTGTGTGAQVASHGYTLSFGVLNSAGQAVNLNDLKAGETIRLVAYVGGDGTAKTFSEKKSEVPTTPATGGTTAPTTPATGGTTTPNPTTPATGGTTAPTTPATNCEGNLAPGNVCQTTPPATGGATTTPATTTTAGQPAVNSDLTAPPAALGGGLAGGPLSAALAALTAPEFPVNGGNVTFRVGNANIATVAVQNGVASYDYKLERQGNLTFSATFQDPNGVVLVADQAVRVVPAAGQLAYTGLDLGWGIFGLGALAVAVGAGAYVLARRRRLASEASTDDMAI